MSCSPSNVPVSNSFNVMHYPYHLNPSIQKGNVGINSQLGPFLECLGLLFCKLKFSQRKYIDDFLCLFCHLQAFAQLLQAPHDDVQLIITDRFPVPRLVICDQHGSQVCICWVIFCLVSQDHNFLYVSCRNCCMMSSACETWITWN